MSATEILCKQSITCKLNTKWTLIPQMPSFSNHNETLGLASKKNSFAAKFDQALSTKVGKNTHTINLYLTILLFMVDISFSKASILLSKLCTELCISGLGVSGLVPESEKKFQVSFPWKSIRKI